MPGFFYLESRFRLNPGEQPAIYTAFEPSSSVFTKANLKGLMGAIDPAEAELERIRDLSPQYALVLDLQL